MENPLLFDPNRCTKCYSCEIACKQENALSPMADAKPGSTGPRWRRMITQEDGVYPNVRVWYTSIFQEENCDMCLQRLGKGELPACVTACTGGAIQFPNEVTIV